MTFGLAFWILMLLWLVLGYVCAPSANPPGFRAYVPNLILFILLLLVGWKLFGAPLHA